jgi:hypothetical protein
MKQFEDVAMGMESKDPFGYVKFISKISLIAFSRL